MASPNGDQTQATFGPEWLSFKSGSYSSDEDPPNGQYFAASKGVKTFYPANKKIPLRFTRSKSTPLLPLEEQPHYQGSKERRPDPDGGPIPSGGTGVFAMLKERNSFDRNFPTLNTLKPRPIVINPVSININSNPPIPVSPSIPIVNSNNKSETGSAWKQSQAKSIIPSSVANSPPNGSSSSMREGNETEMQLASLIVPNVQPPKVLTKNRVELLTKKGPIKKKFDPAALLRKATSEPSLPIPPAYQENYAKLMAGARKTETKYIPPKAPEKDKKPGTVVLNRNDFFRGVVRKDSLNALSQDDPNIQSQHRRVNSADQSELVVSNNISNGPLEDLHQVSSEERTPSGSNANIEMKTTALNITEDTHQRVASGSDSHSVSSKLLSLEDEEKFLRNLGWVPEEEVHVPELTEEEIVEWEAKKSCWMGQKTQRKRLSLDVSIRKWQNDRDRVFVTKIC